MFKLRAVRLVDFGPVHLVQAYAAINAAAKRMAITECGREFNPAVYVTGNLIKGSTICKTCERLTLVPQTEGEG